MDNLENVVSQRELYYPSIDLFPNQGNDSGLGFVTGKIADILHKPVNFVRQHSVWPTLFGLACCAIEMMATNGSRHDMARFGAEVFRASPRQSDLIIISGRVSIKMAPVLRQVYDQMPDPKWVISMGACASCGGVFNNYAIVQGVDKIVPVDVYIAGCPPTPEALMTGFQLLQDKIAAGIPPGKDPRYVREETDKPIQIDLSKVKPYAKSK